LWFQRDTDVRFGRHLDARSAALSFWTPRGLQVSWPVITTWTPDFVRRFWYFTCLARACREQQNTVAVCPADDISIPI
jgi:hypothetical protein